jgi:RNA polymerase sigma factor (sigma-70 family)
MADANDMELMRQYAEEKSENAFAELVQRHISLVYSVAMRYVGNPSDAQDVTQAVFVIFNKKMGGLRQRTTLTGWFYETTRLASRQFLRTKRRQQSREQEAYMQSAPQQADNEIVWRQVAPVLEDAMTRLSEKERTLLALRFFQNKTIAETAALLGVEEWAARKRASRAVEKLQKFFSKRGVSSTTEAITGAISSYAIQPAPAGLAKTISAAAIAKGAAASASTLTLVKGTLGFMAWTNTKTAVAVGIGLLVAAGAGTVVVEKVIKQAGPVLERRLADGSVLTVNRISFGQTATFRWGRPNAINLEFKLAGPSAKTNALARNAFYRQFRCVLRGETGIPWVEDLEQGSFGRGPGGYYGYISAEVFPRDSRWLWITFEKRDKQDKYDSWQHIAEFKFRNPAPVTTNLQWTASPAPVTNSVNGKDVMLGQVTVNVAPNLPNDIWNHIVTMPVQVFDGGVLLTNWGAAYLSGQDASGNSEYMGNPIFRSLDPRYVWKLEVDVEPQANFPTNEVATVTLPGNSAGVTVNVMGLPVTIHRVAANYIEVSIPANRPDLALRFAGAADSQGDTLQSGGGNWNQFSFRRGFFEVIKDGSVTEWDVKAASVTVAVVPNVHTTFYVQPQLVTSQ